MLPVEVGLNFTDTVHFPPTATWDEQLFVCKNWLGLVPARATDVMGKATVAVLVTVIVLAALVTPRSTLPNDSASGAIENVAITPVPDNDTVFVPAPLPAFTDNFADFNPTLVGLNVTVIVHVRPAGTDEPQS